jgi:serine/threonine protein kinase
MQGKKEFLNEVKLVGEIRHRNLVNIIDCCVKGSERLLVYEYLANKSLDKILFDPTKRKHLDWVQRYNTILGDWSGSWASLPPRRFSTPKLFIGILQQAPVEWVYGTRTCYEGASMGIIQRMKCC